MNQPKKLWLDAEGRKHRYLHSQTRETADFGFDEVPADDKARRVKKHFDSVAPVYDFMNTVLSFGIHYAWKRVAVRSMHLRPGQRVLDVCGGTGDLAALAARTVGPSGHVVLYDINRAMMLAGRPRLDRSEMGDRIHWVQGDAEAIALADGAFDAAMVGFGIRNVTRMDRGFAEMYRVLKPGGTLMCLEFSKPVNPVFRWLYDLYSFRIMPKAGDLLAGNRGAYTHLSESIRMFALPEEISAMLEGIGFTRVRFRRLTNGIAVIHTGRKPSAAEPFA